MQDMDFFPQKSTSYPSIYAYELTGVQSHKGYIKIGYTERDVKTRVKEQMQQILMKDLNKFVKIKLNKILQSN